MPRLLVLRNALPSSAMEWKELSQRLASYEVRLNFTGIDSLKEQELDELLSAIPREWDFAEYERVIDTDSLSASIDALLNQVIQRKRDSVSPPHSPHKPPQPPKSPPVILPKHPRPKPPRIRRLIAGSAALACLAVTAISLHRAYTFFTGYRVSQKQIVVGAVNSAKDYETLEAYLEQKLVPDNFWEYFRGDRVQVVVDAATPERDLAYPKAISLVNEHRWDVAFAYSPIVGMAAEDAGYQVIGIMFPGDGKYQASIFVNKDSPIKSLDDINEKHTIALGDFFSASKFYMPSYELFGRRLTVVPNIPSREIFDLVRNGKVDIGVGVLAQEDPNLRVLKQSRDIPGSGVYLSPELTAKDQQVLKVALLNAPGDIRSSKQANYGTGEKPSFEHFRGIVQRVREIMACSDFRRNPVDFYCNPTKATVRIEGRINGIEKKGNDYFALVNQFNGKICSLHITNDALMGLSIVDSAFDLQGYYVDAIAAIAKGSQCTKEVPVEIFQPNQIELSRKPNDKQGNGS